MAKPNFNPKLAIWFFIFSVFISCMTLAEGHFDAGLSALQKNDLKSARVELQSSLQASPSQAQIYYDLGLVEYKDGHQGLAIGLWRKALTLKPNDVLSQAALQFAMKKLPHPSIAHEAENWEALRDSTLQPVSLLSFLLMANFLLLASGWVLLGYFGQRKRALSEDSPAPPAPFLGAFFAGLCLFFFGLSLAKWIDLQTTRATVVAPTLAVRTSPDEKSASLFDLFEGLEVVVQQTSNDWLQVTYPGGLTGWAPKSSLFVTSGHHP